MAAITGGKGKIALGTTGTFGTAATLSTGALSVGRTYTVSENAEALSVSPIGSGTIMQGTSDTGAVAPTVESDGPLAYNGPDTQAIAQFFGGNSVMNMGSSVYMQSIFLNATPNQSKTITFAQQVTTTSSIEIPSLAVTQVTLNYPAPPDYLSAAISMLGDQIRSSGQTNTFSQLENATEADDQKIVWQNSDSFLINSFTGGTLSSGDLVQIESATLTLQRPQAHARVAKGSAGNALPVSEGEFPFLGTLSIVLKTDEDIRFWTESKAGAEYKAELLNTGPAIAGGGGKYYQFNTYLPLLKIVSTPGFDTQTAAFNSRTIEFLLLLPAAAPTGFLSNYPYILNQGTRATAWLA